MIGINTAISTQTGGYQGVGFAIPASLAKWVSRQLIATGKVRRAYLGVTIQPVTQPLAKEFGVAVSQGALVAEVADGTPAAKAGVKPGDVIVEVAGKKVSNPQQLQEIVEVTAIGVPQPMTVIRNGKSVKLDVALGEQPADYGLARDAARLPGSRQQAVKFDKLGIQAETLTADVAKRLGVRAAHGALITEVRAGSPAAQAGWESGMVIVEAARHAVATADDLKKILEQQSLEKGVLFVIQTSQGTHFTVLSTGE